MFNKFLNVGRPFFSRGRAKTMAQPQQEAEESDQDSSSVLKIVHAGGIVESYYMAIPAVTIMNKYPSYRLAKPEVFRRPWDSLVKSDEILTPGEKFYVVPRHTVRKLRRRIKKPPNINNGEVSVNSFISHSQCLSSINNINVTSKDIGFSTSSKSIVQGNDVSDSSGLFSAIRKNKTSTTTKKHVRFVGIDTAIAKQKKLEKSNLKQEEQGNNINGDNTKKKSNGNGGKRKLRNGVLWQPNLTAISEHHGAGE